MFTTHLSSKGQIVIPSSICKAHKWMPGLEFIIEDSGESAMLRPTRPFAASSFSEVSACLAYKGSIKNNLGICWRIFRIVYHGAKEEHILRYLTISMAENGLDFADALHLASSKGVEIIYLKNHIFRLIRESRL
ncbi:MAG: hypothetical protein WCP55_24245 [Lentisphaerota bacterium]